MSDVIVIALCSLILYPLVILPLRSHSIFNKFGNQKNGFRIGVIGWVLSGSGILVLWLVHLESFKANSAINGYGFLALIICGFLAIIVGWLMPLVLLPANSKPFIAEKTPEISLLRERFRRSAHMPQPLNHDGGKSSLRQQARSRQDLRHRRNAYRRNRR